MQKFPKIAKYKKYPSGLSLGIAKPTAFKRVQRHYENVEGFEGIFSRPENFGRIHFLLATGEILPIVASLNNEIIGAILILKSTYKKALLELPGYTELVPRMFLVGVRKRYEGKGVAVSLYLYAFLYLKKRLNSNFIYSISDQKLKDLFVDLFNAEAHVSPINSNSWIVRINLK